MGDRHRRGEMSEGRVRGGGIDGLGLGLKRDDAHQTRQTRNKRLGRNELSLVCMIE